MEVWIKEGCDSEEGKTFLSINSRIICSAIQALVGAPYTHPPSLCSSAIWAEIKYGRERGGCPSHMGVCMGVCLNGWVLECVHDRLRADWTMGELYEVCIHVALIHCHTQQVGNDQRRKCWFKERQNWLISRWSHFWIIVLQRDAKWDQMS